MKKKKLKLLALVLAVMLLVTSLSGCGGAPARSTVLPGESVSQAQSSSQGLRSDVSQPGAKSPAEGSRDEVFGETVSESAGLDSEDVEVSSSESSSRTTVRERMERLKEQQKAAQESSGSSQSEESSKAPASSGSSSRTTVRERMERLRKQQKAAQESSGSSQSEESSKVPASSGTEESSKAPASSGAGENSKSSSASSKPQMVKKLRVGPGLEDIAQLMGLEAEVETRLFACVVDVDEGENPYDVTWDYGELYDAFVQEVDWDLVFDGDYYIRTFPALAHLYHKDKALLLRHFQTVGIHEGRQGCEDFNVAAHQKNCDAKIREALGTATSATTSIMP